MGSRNVSTRVSDEVLGRIDRFTGSLKRSDVLRLVIPVGLEAIEALSSEALAAFVFPPGGSGKPKQDNPVTAKVEAGTFDRIERLARGPLSRAAVVRLTIELGLPTFESADPAELSRLVFPDVSGDK